MRATSIILGMGITLITLIILRPPYDDTDDAKAGNHSGMTLYTDNLTGCQYLGVRLGGLTPRRDGAGRHVGCRSYRKP